MTSEALQQLNLIQQFPVTANPFSNLYVDLTQRCNMDCNFCYNPERSNNDLDPAYFRQVCQRLPSPVNWRFLGGEPTMHPHFFDFLDIALGHGHSVFFASNGVKYRDDSFMRRLQDYSGQITAGLSMDGGTRDDSFYQLLNNRPCLEEKLESLKALSHYSIGRVCLSAIILRGENESVMKELYDLALQHPDVVRYIHFRSVAKLGRWRDTTPYNLEELKDLAWPIFNPEEFTPACVREINCNGGDGDCCYRFRPTQRLQISLIEFASARSAECPYRGKLLEGDFLIESFFGNMIKS
ncbi:MAG: radical SAM protein [Gammaproteobacteria bacterium]|nr:radical SAM protein [Gammaproteobacteria bacterium]